MPYTPGPFPHGTDPVMVREFHAVSSSQGDARTVVAFAPTSVEPAKPRDGMMVKAVAPWDPGYGYGPYMYDSTLGWNPMFGAAVSDSIIVACSDESTNLTTGLKRTFWWPYPVEIDEVHAGLVTAATGSVFTVDVKVDGTSMLSTKITIDSGEYTSLTAATQPVISTASHDKGGKVTIHIDQIGSTVAGAGLKVWFVLRKVSA